MSLFLHWLWLIVIIKKTHTHVSCSVWTDQLVLNSDTHNTTEFSLFKDDFYFLFSQWMPSKWIHWDQRGRMRWVCGAWSPRTARRAWTRQAWRPARGLRSRAARPTVRGRTASAPAAGTAGPRWSQTPRPQRTLPTHPPTGRKTRNHWGCTVSFKVWLVRKHFKANRAACM